MNNTNKILIGAAVLQAALMAVTWSSGVGRAGGSSEAQPLLDVPLAEVSAIAVSDRGEGEEKAESVSLVRKGEAWVVGGADDFPADTKKIEEVIGKLLKATHREPIATKAANHNALDVGERTYDKKVELTVGGEKKTLILGSGKGSSVHARFEGKDDVYLARGISSWAVGNKVDTYVDTQYVEVKEPVEVRVVNRNGPIDLVKGEGDVWAVAQLKPDAKVDPSRVRSFVTAARSVRLTAPVGKAVKPEFGLGEGAVTVSVRDAEKTVSYRIGAEDGDFRYVKADDNDYVVKVRKYAVDDLIKQTADKFVEEVPAPTAPGMPGMPPGMQGFPGGIPGLPPGLQMPPPGGGQGGMDEGGFDEGGFDDDGHGHE